MKNLRVELRLQLSSFIIQAAGLTRFEATERVSIADSFAKLVGRLGAITKGPPRTDSLGPPLTRGSGPHNIADTSREFVAGMSAQWKEVLHQESVHSARAESARITQFVGLICRDLEDRCKHSRRTAPGGHY